MTDLKDLFELALADSSGRPGGTAPDAGADLARGKQLLRRRHARFRAVGAGVVVVAAAAVIVPTVTTGGSSTAPSPTAAHQSAPTATAQQPAPSTASSASTTSIKLVAYTGKQPDGYVVKVIPDGWVIQGSNPYSLVIAPADAANKDPNFFIGKLVVMQEAFDPSNAPDWSPVSVPGHTAYYSVQDAGGTPTASMVIKEASGSWLVVQVPTSLGWTKAELADFATGVTILSTAQEGQG